MLIGMSGSSESLDKQSMRVDIIGKDGEVTDIIFNGMLGDISEDAGIKIGIYPIVNDDIGLISHMREFLAELVDVDVSKFGIKRKGGHALAHLLATVSSMRIVTESTKRRFLSSYRGELEILTDTLVNITAMENKETTPLIPEKGVRAKVYYGDGTSEVFDKFIVIESDSLKVGSIDIREGRIISNNLAQEELLVLARDMNEQSSEVGKKAGDLLAEILETKDTGKNLFDLLGENVSVNKREEK